MRIKISCKAKFDRKSTAALRRAQGAAFAMAAKDVVDDLKASKTLPYRTGALEEATDAAVVERKQSEAQVATRVPYAGLLYNRTDLRYRQTRNENAGAQWFEPYIRGGKTMVWLERFGVRLRELLSRRGNEK